ncbi:hypothetical protein LJC15_02495 [Desulfovibrio sp. OttesenSCG-928-G11]|nr:hypothetical protein [Desulfovibrio sp. OttesenSCG-928-G11]
MKKALSFILVLVISLCSVSYSFALSDADYKKYKQESVKFAIADKDLSQTWKMIKGMNGGKIPSALMAEQKQWIQVDRDAEAQKLFNTMSPADAYAAVTNQRIEILRTKWLMGNSAQGTSVQSYQENTSADDIAGVYGYTQEDDDGSVYAISIEIKNRGGNRYHVTGFQQSITGVNHVNEFEGTGSIIDGILIVKGKIGDGLGGIRYQSAILKIYSKPHPDLIKYGDKYIKDAESYDEIETKKYYTAKGNQFKSLIKDHIAILSDHGFVDVCPKK